jgi:Spy/CpxP family protein refolding chaperone
MIRAIIRTGFAVAALAFFGVAVNAQVKSPNTGITPPAEQQGPTRTDGPRRGRMGRGGQHGEFGPSMGLRQLNLTETQRQQMHDLRTKFEKSITPLGDEMRQIRTKFDQATATIEDQQRAQALRQQMRTAHEQLMTEFQALLTPEQQEQLKAFRQQMEQRREEFRQRRGAGHNQDAPLPVQ